jgi:hypothetical protein
LGISGEMRRCVKSAGCFDGQRCMLLGLVDLSDGGIPVAV